MCSDYEKIVTIFKKPWKIFLDVKEFLNKFVQNFSECLKPKSVIEIFLKVKKKFSWNIEVFRNASKRIHRKTGKKFQGNYKKISRKLLENFEKLHTNVKNFR